MRVQQPLYNKLLDGTTNASVVPERGSPRANRLYDVSQINRRCWGYFARETQRYEEARLTSACGGRGFRHEQRDTSLIRSHLKAQRTGPASTPHKRTDRYERRTQFALKRKIQFV